MSLTSSAAAEILTAAAVVIEKPDDPHEPRWGDQTRGQRDLYTQLVLSLALGLTAFFAFCVCPLIPWWFLNQKLTLF